MQFWSTFKFFELKQLSELDQNCIFEENKSGYHQISERKSVDQNCIGTHLPSRERGGRGPKIIPPCTTDKLIITSTASYEVRLFSKVLRSYKEA